MRIRTIAFGIGRKIGKHPFASRLFCMVEPILPVQRIARSVHSVAFYHPKPSEDGHILVVPTVPFPALAASKPDQVMKSRLLWDMLQLAARVGERDPADWQVILNGGMRQDIGQVHGHLIHRTIEALTYEFTLENPEFRPEHWHQLFARIDKAHAIPGNGYSLICIVGTDDNVTVAFTQSASI